MRRLLIVAGCAEFAALGLWLAWPGPHPHIRTAPRAPLPPLAATASLPRRTHEPAPAWPTYGYDNARDRVARGIRLRPPFRRSWTFHGRALLEFPPVVADGRVYVANFNGRFFALDARSGRTLWHFDSGRCGWASPAIAASLVYIAFIGNYECRSAARDGELVAFDARSGRVRWLRRVGPTESSPLVFGGRVYIGDWSGRVYAFAARTGRLAWTFSATGAVKGSLAQAGRALFIGTYAGNIYAVDASDGRELWSAGGGAFYSTPAVAGGRVFIGSLDSDVYAYNAADGRRLWSASTDGYVYASPAVWDGLVLLGSYDDTFYALAARTGAVRWRFHVGAPISGAASVVDGVVYFSSFDEHTYALAARTGRKLAEWADGKYSPVVADRRHLYLVGLGRVYALVPRS